MCKHEMLALISELSVFFILPKGTMMIENAEIIASIPCRHKSSPSYYHSFGLTEDYIIFVEQPLYVDEECVNGYRPANNSPKHLRWKRNEMVSKLN